MRIQSLSSFRFPVPFKRVFRHASAARSQAENLIVEVRSVCGQVGYGEGCPRAYVTGETAETCLRFISDHQSALAKSVRNMATLREWMSAHRHVIDRNPAAFCAIELAILDLMGKCDGTPLECLVGTKRARGPYRYTAVLGDASFPVYFTQALQYWSSGFRDFKIKLSGDKKRDRKKLRALLALPARSARIRLDANNIWRSPNECSAHLLELPGRFFAVEEPLQKGDLDGMHQVAVRCGTKIVLDESISRVNQVRELGEPETWVLNIRVSKMGGILRSLEVVEAASRHGVAVIVGAQVGETSVLTRAALPVAAAAAADRFLLANEGAFGTHLLTKDLTGSSIMFGRGGHLDPIKATNKHAPGLGLKVNRDLLIPA